MQPTFAQQSYRNGKRELFQKRNERFNKIRNLPQHMEQEIPKQIEENIEQLDYSRFYPENNKTKLNDSLKMPIPAQLPPLDLLTISLYRRAGKSVYQCKPFGTNQLDPHMTYESLLMLGHNESKDFGNYKALVKQFQRDFKLYLKIDSKDIRDMAIIAAGNKILGREEDILALIQHYGAQFLWVLINHVYESKISSRYLLPYFLNRNQQAFKAFSQLTNNIGDESIAILTDSDQAINCLISALDVPGELCKMSIEIICNIFGQGEGYWKLFVGSHLLDKCSELLLKSDNELKIPLLRMLCNFVFESGAATTALRNQNLMSLLLNLLIQEFSPDLKKELLNIFSFLVYKAEQRQAFEAFVQAELFSICSVMIGISEQLDLGALQLVCGLVELGEKFPNEENENVAGLLVSSNSTLVIQVQQLRDSKNNYVSGMSFVILEKLRGNQQEQQQL